MSERGTEEKIKIKNPAKFIFFRILIFITLALGTALVLRPAQLALHTRMEAMRDSFISEAESFLGRKIQYGSMGPSIFGTLDIRDVLIQREDGSVFLSVDRLRLSYSLIQFYLGNSNNIFHSLRLDRPVLSLDFQRDSDLFQRFSSLELNGASFPVLNGNGNLRFVDLIPDNFSLRIWNGEWAIFDPRGNFTLYRVGIDASIQENRLSFQGRWNAGISLFTGNRISAFLPDSPNRVFQASMRGRINGDYFLGNRTGSATLQIPSINGDFFRFRPIGFNFFLSENRLDVRKTHDRSSSAFTLAYDFTNERFWGSFEAENFSPNYFLSFIGPWASYNPILASRFSGAASFNRENSENRQFNIDFSGLGPGSFPANPILSQARLDIKLTGDREYIVIDNFDIRSPSGGSLSFQGGVDLNPDFSDIIAPYGYLSLSNFRLRTDQGISGDFTIRSDEQKISLIADNVSTGTTSLAAFDFALLAEGRGLAFDFSALKFQELGSFEYVRMGTISLQGGFAYNPRQLQGTVRLDSIAIGDILSFVEPFAPLAVPVLLRSAMDDLSLNTEIFFSTDFNSVIYNAPRIVLVYEGLTDINAALSISGTNRGLDLSFSRISWANGTVDFNGFADFSNSDNTSFSLAATYRNLTYFFNGTIRDRRNMDIRGSYGFQLFLTSGPDGTLSGHTRGEMIPIPSGDRFASLSFFASLAHNSPESWRAALENFELTGLSTPGSSSASLRFTAMANERGLSIPNIRFDDGRGALGGFVSLDWDPAFSFCAFRSVIYANNSDEFYSLDGEFRDNRLELSFAGRRMQFARFSSRNAIADGTFNLSWESPTSFTADADIPYFALFQQNNVIRASARVSIDNDEFLAEQVRLNYSGLEAVIPFIRIDRAASLAQTEAEIWGLFSQRPVDISLQGGASFNASESWIDLFSDFESLDGSLLVKSAVYDDIIAEEPFAFLFNVNQENGGFGVRVNGGPRDMLRFRYTPERTGGGVFFTALSAPSPVRGTIAGFIDSETIDAQGSDLYVDMGSLWRFVPPLNVIAFPAGIVNASIQVSGSLREPEFFGSARGTSLQILVPGFIPEPIRPAPVLVTLNGNEMSFGPINAAVGQGAGRATGHFRFDEWIPNIFTIDIIVPPESPIPCAFEIAGVVTDGLVSGRLILSMEDLIFSVHGDFIAHDTVISLNTAEVAAIMADGRPISDEDGLISISTDISIRAGRRVEFFWPSIDFPVIQANADMGTGIHITSDELARRFSLTGDVRLRGGEISYLDRNFFIREGTLFFRENETQFDPRISARAEIRDRADVGPVTISMIIDNAPLRSFTPRFVSSPPLSPLDIYAILGHVPQGDGELRNLVTSVVMDSLSQYVVVGRLQRQVRNFLGLDMLSMRTQLLQNVVFQRGGNPFNPSNTAGPNRFGNYFDNTSVFLGKFIGAEIFGEAMFSFRYDDSRANWGGMVIEPELSLEMRNPLFDIRFNLLPSRPDTMFIDDVSFSFLWRRTF